MDLDSSTTSQDLSSGATISTTTGAGRQSDFSGELYVTGEDFGELYVALAVAHDRVQLWLRQWWLPGAIPMAANRHV